MGDADEGLERARELLAAGDVPGLVRHLRADGGTLPLGEVAGLVVGLARLAGLGDLEWAAVAAAADGDKDAQALYDLGYACLDQGLPFLAVRPLERALELAPGSPAVLGELVDALEEDGRHARAVAVLEEHEPLKLWMHRFQYVYNALMAGRLDKAADGFRRLPEPEDHRWVPAREKVRRMLARADVMREVTPLDCRDLRGWHYVLTGGILASLSPYWFHAGMSGRWCYLGDSGGECAAALRRLGLVLGLAAAMVLGLPTADFSPGRPAARSLVVAYDLNAADPDVVAALRCRAPGQVLFERATCWTDPPRVAADVSGLLGEHVLAPWDGQWQRLDDGSIGQGPADDRPAEVIAAELAGTEPERDEGDGSAPADPDDGLRSFARAVADDGARERDGGWLAGPREWVRNSGPVPSSRFA